MIPSPCLMSAISLPVETFHFFQNPSPTLHKRLISSFIWLVQAQSFQRTWEFSSMFVCVCVCKMLFLQCFHSGKDILKEVHVDEWLNEIITGWLFREYGRWPYHNLSHNLPYFIGQPVNLHRVWVIFVYKIGANIYLTASL